MTKKKDSLSATTSKAEAVSPDKLFTDLIGIIEGGKQYIYRHANSGVVLTYWKVGKRINDEILGNERAEYGKQIIATVSRQLHEKYGRGFENANVRRMMQFAKQFEDEKIVATISRQLGLGWSHIVELLPLKEMAAKLYYAGKVSEGLLGIKALRQIIYRKAYERRDIANAELTEKSAVPFNVFKDPYLLDTLGLKDNPLEADLEKAIVGELENFIMEFGKGFTFAERQKRMIIDGDDYYLDLLFYNRELKRLVAVELKVGKFKPAFKGQMELYLNWLNEYERKDGENAPIGIILCTSANRQVVELLGTDKAGIAVAEYWTKFPPKEQFEHKIQELMVEAKERMERRQLLGTGENKKQIDYFIEPDPDDDEG
ncbi:DUF1016 domain-containing protein [Clostridia bacterium]|nr:DUF1016 domain-containing protein [Clostridia bacterium]